MIFFLITFLTLYGGMHLYIYLKLRAILPPRPYLVRLLFFWLIVMTFIPLIVRVAEQFSMEKIALVIAWPGYIWMGFIFIFCSVHLPVDVILRLSNGMAGQKRHSLATTISKSVCLIAVIASMYALWEAGQIRSERVVITSSKISNSIKKIRIVQISDVHIGLLMQERRLRQIIEKIQEANPDILISTGDLVDGKLNRDDTISALNPLAALFSAIPAPSGKFAVLGNHEVYAGLPQAVAFTTASGFTVLRNQSIMLANNLIITALDDRAVNRTSVSYPEIETVLLNSVAKDSFHLLLKHRPEILPSSDGRFDLQLSGHIHGGQIFPFNFLVKLKHSIPCGTTITPTGSRIHVSRGTGTWGPPMRLFAPPEITIVDIIPATTIRTGS